MVCRAELSVLSNMDHSSCGLAVRFMIPILRFRTKIPVASKKDPQYFQQTRSGLLGRIKANSPFFHYTSGRWVYNEQSQLKKHYVEFGVLALQRTASRIVGSRCVQM
ncbi:uncharacterized protein BDW43DRAFT_276850, partial [Aspergillus alliaceus]|uniref:uncharacterized protein n=1 Tax=Petromyces alliaceus TaxID=209559 RepID=UPI0012A40822